MTVPLRPLLREVNALLAQYPTPDESQDTYRPYYAEMDATPQGRDTGRSARFPSGWWVGPGVLVGALMWAAAGWGVCSFVADARATGIATAAEAREVAKW